MTDTDVVIVGAGPSGAAAALLLARRGHRVTVLERGRFPRDKVCGEGLMPSGLPVLSRLGLLDAVIAAGSPRLHGVTYDHPGGAPRAMAAFPEAPGGRTQWGLGVRRTIFGAILVDALRGEPGVTLLEGTRASGLLRAPSGLVGGVRTGLGGISGQVVIAADGLHSPMRAAAGWTSPPQRAGRYGLVGHWRLDTKGIDGITVTLAGDHEWYQAPVAPGEIVVSILGSRQPVAIAARDYTTAARSAVTGLKDAELSSAPLGAGQFHQRPLHIAADSLFLVGDAAGYDDPTTAEGLSIGLQLAERLALHVSAALSGQISVSAAEIAYTRDHRRLWRDRRRLTSLALVMARVPWLSRRAVTRAAHRPQALSVLLGINCGYWGFGRLSPRDWLTLAGI